MSFTQHLPQFAIALACAIMPSSALSQTPTDAALISFESNNESRAWRTVNDGVMGGRSSGGSVVMDGELVFEGVINTNGGGFSSVRREMPVGALEGAEALTLSVRSDGRSYRLIARNDVRHAGRAVSWQADIPQTEPGEWASARVPFDAFRPSVFGRQVPAGPFRPETVNELGFIIADGVDGPFSLRVRSIDVSD